MKIRQIAVLGAGTMGHGIAHAAIAGGYETRMFDVSDAALQKGRTAIDGINARTGGADQYPQMAPIADPLNSCSRIEVQRQPGVVPPNVNVFSALLNLFR